MSKRRWITGTALAAAVGLSACLPPTGLDPTFGSDGVRPSALSETTNDRFYDVANGPDGSVYGAGFVVLAGGDSAFAVTKVLSDGSSDTSFGTEGTAVVNVTPGGGEIEQPRSIAVQPNGRILVAGTTDHDPGAPGLEGRDTDWAVVRLTANGRPDRTFGVNGVQTFDLGIGVDLGGSFFGDQAYGVGVLPGGRIVLHGVSRGPGEGRIDLDFTLIGLTPNGSIDPNFGTNGITRVDGGAGGSGFTFDNARGVLVEPNGRIVTSGYALTTRNQVRPVLIRTNSRGQLDRSFGNLGVATRFILGETSGTIGEGYNVRRQGDDYILVGYGRRVAEDQLGAIAFRFRGNGVWDDNFGATGTGVTIIDAGPLDDRFRNVTVLPDGRVLAVGSSRTDAGNVEALTALLDADGKPIASYGGGDGFERTDFGGLDAWWGVTVTPDLKFAYLAGFNQAPPDSGEDDDAVLGRIALR